MANAVEKVNTIAIASIEAINTRTDANIQALNGLEFTGYTYNGITWSTDDAIPAGTASAGLSGKVGTVLLTMMGLASPVSYEHDGSSWSSSTATGGAKHDHGHAGGTQGAAVIYGGYDGSDDGDTTDEYNGTSWSNVNSMPGGTYGASGGGEVQSTCFVTGGSTFNPYAYPMTLTMTYDGTTWTNESVASDGFGSGNAQNSGGGGLDACFKAVGVYEGQSYSTGSSLFNQTAGSWTSKATVSVGLVYTVTCSDGVRVYKIGGFGPPGGAYSGSNMHDTVESWVENSWTAENSLPVKTITAGMGSGGQQALGGAFQAGGAYWNGSSKVNASTQYYIAAATP